MACNMNNGMNCNSGRNMNGMNRNSDRSMNGMNCNSGKNMNGMNCNSDRNMGRNTGFNNTRGTGNCGMNRNGNHMGHPHDMTPTCGCGRRSRDNDGCDIGNEHVDHMTPAMAYVPWQKWEDIMNMEETLCQGTIFAQLDKPYIGRKVK